MTRSRVSTCSSFAKSIERREFAVGTGVENRQFTDLNGADAITLRLEFCRGGAGRGRLRASRLRRGGYRPGQGGEAGRKRHRRTRPKQEFKVTTQRRTGREPADQPRHSRGVR